MKNDLKLTKILIIDTNAHVTRIFPHPTTNNKIEQNREHVRNSNVPQNKLTSHKINFQ